MSVHLGQCGRCYYGDMQGEIKREDGVREGFLEEKTLKLRFEGGVSQRRKDWPAF